MSEAMIFVFGSNEAGIHGAGAAKYAFLNKGSIRGQGFGLMGKSFGIPTKDREIKTLPLEKICVYINKFIYFAEDHPELDFKVTRIGCGLAGYKDGDIAPMFFDAPPNCQFDYEWKGYFDSENLFPKYWGTQ